MRRNRCFEVMVCFFFAGLGDCVGGHVICFISFFLVLMVLVGVWGTIHCFVKFLVCSAMLVWLGVYMGEHTLFFFFCWFGWVCMWGSKLYFLQFVCFFLIFNVFLWWFGAWCVCGGACSAELCVPSSLQPPQCAGLNTQKTNSQHDSNRNTKH